jgi:PGF-pre-PGF domain-containing protein
MIVCQLIIEVPDILGLQAGLRTMKMKVDFLNSIITIFLITLIIPGVISCIASAGDEDYSSSSNSSGIADSDSDEFNYSNSDEFNYSNSEEFNYSNSEEFNYSNSEEFNYSNSEEFNYSNSEEYLTEDQIYAHYDSSISDLDVVRDLYWMGIDVIEPEANVYTKELVVRNIMGGYPVRFDFVENATSITYIEFDPIKTFRKTTTTAEVLKDISVFTPELPAGTIYQYIDILVGDKGAGLPTSLRNGLIEFRVEKTWFKDNDVNESKITLQRYNNSWETLYTEKVREDKNYIYFQSNTPGFYFFAITEYAGKADENYTEEYLNNTEEPDENYTEEADENYTEEADEDYTEEADEDYTEPDENCTGKADLNYTEETDKNNCTGKANENCTKKQIKTVQKKQIKTVQKKQMKTVQKKQMKTVQKKQIKTVQKKQMKTVQEKQINCQEQQMKTVQKRP